jgi:hypothetical protein
VHSADHGPDPGAARWHGRIEAELIEAIELRKSGR